MNTHTQLSNESKLGIKAYQNLVGSVHAFDRFTALLPTGDHILLSSVFCFAVVKYAKPFIDTVTSFGKTRYPVRHLKGHADFDNTLHKHLLELRNTLVAHDDLESIEPKLLQFGMGMSIDSIAFNIPVSIALSNKCLAYPIDPESGPKLKKHVAACAQGALKKIYSDVAKFREATLKYPEQAAEGARYQKNYGQIEIEKNGTQLQSPDFMSDDWLNNSEPNFSHIHSGLLYEELRIRRDFYGPEKIQLPDGSEIQLVPTGESRPAE